VPAHTHSVAAVVFIVRVHNVEQVHALVFVFVLVAREVAHHPRIGGIERRHVDLVRTPRVDVLQLWKTRHVPRLEGRAAHHALVRLEERDHILEVSEARWAHRFWLWCWFWFALVAVRVLWLWCSWRRPNILALPLSLCLTRPRLAQILMPHINLPPHAPQRPAITHDDPVLEVNLVLIVWIDIRVSRNDVLEPRAQPLLALLVVAQHALKSVNAFEGLELLFLLGA
jgi:hypothetical protein